MVIERWQDAALCKGQEDLFFAKDVGNISYVAASKVCGACQVSSYCRASSLFEDEGYWAGTAPRDRQRARTSMGYTLDRDSRLAPRMARACDDAYANGEDPQDRIAKIVGEDNAHYLMNLKNWQLKSA